METNRLIHKPFTNGDLDRLVELRSDPDVAKYIGGAKAMTREWNKMRLEFYMSCYKHRLGMHGMYWKETDEMIGWSGLQPLEGGEEIEVSYGLSKDFWQMGVGNETAEGWLKYGFKELQLERIVAVAMPENKGSWRIMEKLGMSFEKNEEHYGMECVVYEVSRDDWLKRDA